LARRQQGSWFWASRIPAVDAVGVLPGGEAGARRKQCAGVAVACHDVNGVVWLARREARRDTGGVAVLAASWKGGIGGWVAARMDDGVGSGGGCWYF